MVYQEKDFLIEIKQTHISSLFYLHNTLYVTTGCVYRGKETLLDVIKEIPQFRENYNIRKSKNSHAHTY